MWMLSHILYSSANILQSSFCYIYDDMQEHLPSFVTTMYPPVAWSTPSQTADFIPTLLFLPLTIFKTNENKGFYLLNTGKSF